MVRTSLSKVLPLAALIGWSSAHALSPGDRVDNFRLIDDHGKSHELYYLSDMKAVVLYAQGDGCAASQGASSAIDALRKQYQGQPVEVLMINSNLKDSRENVNKATSQAGIETPVLVDETQLIGESLGFTQNGEVLVVNPQDWKVAYRGAVSAGGKQYAADAVSALVAGQAVKTASTPAAGCAINLPQHTKQAMAAHAKISYEKTIAPMLIDKCVTCHRDGGIGPWQMTSYQIVKGFSPMIREVIRTERMPPWHADPHYQAFSNDRSLSNDQIKTLVHWIEAGAPRGDGKDPLAEYHKQWPTWPLGEPDLVVSTPAFKVPATGVIPYQMVVIDNPLDHDVWVRAIDYLPGERSVLHHVVASVGGERRGGSALSNYVPGMVPLQVPKDDGILIKKGDKFYLQMHFTANGKELTDVTKMGLYFRNDTPKYTYRSQVLAQPKLKIPAGDKNHAEEATTTFQKDVLVYSLHPHSHFRGSSAKFVAYYPDGREEVLLNVPRYDFNWQSTYELTTPKVFPAGTKVVYTGTYDNSTQNKANPDPTRTVTWGEQTWDEMLFGVIRYRYTTEDAAAVSASNISANNQ